MTSTPTQVTPAPLAPDALATYVGERLEERVTDHLVAYDQLTVTVRPDALPMAAQLCRDDPALAFDFFDFLTGVDEREDGFAVIVHLYSTRHRHHIQIRAVPEGGREAPTLPTISHLYAGANWHERETYDMFGITFEGHPGLLPRILTVENFEGFPLRKEFLLMTREVKPWPGLKEPKEAKDDEDGDGDTTATGPSAEEKARMAREKAERAKAKAAEARRRRARERAERSEAAGGHPQERAAGQAETAGAGAAAETETPAGDGDVGAEKDAALAAGAGDDEIAGDPIEAAAVSDEPIAKDAAAGAVGGDTAAGAPGDVPGGDQPVEDDADETTGMVSDTQDAEAGPPGDQTPAPDADVTPAFQGDDGGAGLPPRGPGEEEPRALTGDGVGAVPLADEGDAEVGPTTADRPDLARPMGTDADDRLRSLDDDDDEEQP